MSVTVYSEIVYPNHVRRRYEVSLTDNIGGSHSYILGMFNHQPDNDGSEVEAQKLASLKAQEAEASSEVDEEIVEKTFAVTEEVALAFLRKAYSMDDPYQSFRRFDRFNNYRLLKGWTMEQVVDGLTSVGLTQEEWDLMKIRYAYLGDSGRVTIMENYQTVLAGDPRVTG